MKSKLDPEKLPRHIGIIMDGNGRWAKKRHLPRPAGHREGVKTLESVLKSIFELNIPYLTVYAFSTENTARPEDEVKKLLGLIRLYFKQKMPEFLENRIRLRVIGDKSYFTPKMQTLLNEAEAKTAGFSERTFTVALNYGARGEIIRAVNKAVKEGHTVTEAEFSELLDTQGLPDPDIIIRTGGESRLSNFLLYQAAYAELFFIPDLWPDFNTERLHAVLEEYGARNRRYGKI